jgi:hypothetical protein
VVHNGPPDAADESEALPTDIDENHQAKAASDDLGQGSADAVDAGDADANESEVDVGVQTSANSTTGRDGKS